MTRQMNDLVTQRTARNLNDRIPWKNGSGEEIPKYGCVRLDSFDAGTELFTVVKPDGLDGVYVASGPVPVADDKNGGSGLWNLPRAVLTDGALSVGDELGPVEDEWFMDATGTGFRIVVPPDANDIAVVDRIGQGGSPSRHLIFQVVSHDPDTRTAIGQIEAVWPAGPVPGSYLEDTVVDICDMMGCFFNRPGSGSLTGVWGFATYMVPRVVTVCDPEGYATLNPRWIVHSLCCPNTCVE